VTGVVDEGAAKRRDQLEALSADLERAVSELASEDAWKDALRMAAAMRSHSFTNTLLIAAQHAAAYEAGTVPSPTPRAVAGYQQWRALGRQVARGQHGYKIFAPVTARMASRTPNDTASWRRLGKGEEPKPGETVRRKMIGTRIAHVWDVTQTDGPPLGEPSRPEILAGQAPDGLVEALEVEVLYAGFAVGYANPSDDPLLRTALGYTDLLARSVTVRSDVDPAQQVKTLAHELGHVLMHATDPEVVPQLLHRGRLEVEAESFAFMVATVHGMDTSSYSIPYVTGWADGADAQAKAAQVRLAGETVRRHATAVLEAIESAPTHAHARPPTVGAGLDTGMSTTGPTPAAGTADVAFPQM